MSTHDLPIRRGDRVRVPKGTLVATTHGRQVLVTKRSYVVKIHHVYEGYTYAGVTHPARVVWAGAGQYWKEADMADVELVERPI